MKGYEICASLQRAFQSLTFENYTNFVLKVWCTAVDVYYINWKYVSRRTSRSLGKSAPRIETLVLFELSMTSVGVFKRCEYLQ